MRLASRRIAGATGVWRDLVVLRGPTEVDCQVGELVERERSLGRDMSLNRRAVELIHQVEGGRPMGWGLLEQLAAAGRLP